MVIGKTQVTDKTGETTAAGQLLQEPGIRERIVAPDTLHAREGTARIGIDRADADDVITATNENRKTIAGDLQSIDFSRQGKGTCNTVDRDGIREMELLEALFEVASQVGRIRNPVRPDVAQGRKGRGIETAMAEVQA